MISNLSNNEYYRLYGTLSPDRIEALLDKSDQLESLDGIEAHIQEACCQFPAEDFLVPVQDRLRDLAKKLRGDNRQEVLGIIEQLDDINQCQVYATGYAVEELGKVEKALKP